MFRMSRLKAKMVVVQALGAFRRLYLQSPARAEELKSDMLDLVGCIDRGEKVSSSAKKMKKKLAGFRFKGPVRRLFDTVLGLAIALAAAVVIRQMWFELFQVPTGSMRPTIREKDNLIMSKDAFGINIPLSRGHFAFNEKDLKRLSVTLFTGMGLPIENNHTIYFWLFPGVKQYVKRCIAKGGDQLYFYGGKVYGLDKEGRALGLESTPILEKLDYVPYLTMEGSIHAERAPGRAAPQLIGSQMNTPVYRAEVYGDQFVDAEFFDGERWQRPGKKNGAPSEYRDLWGMGGFAKARMIESKEGLALELFTLPNFTQKAWQVHKMHGTEFARLVPIRSEISLGERHLNALMDNLYTSRFVVKENRAFPYDYQGRESQFAPTLPVSTPNGTYEFQNGRLYSVSWTGSKEVTDKSHPLFTRTAEMAKILFNMGISFNTLSGKSGDIDQVPMRYAYYRSGDLFVMGTKVFDKKDSNLAAFIKSQKERATREGSLSAFAPFIDRGPPSAETIRQFGLKVPKDHALMLGDNHANSGDSRLFGFVPYRNIRGTAEVVFWPPRDSGRIAQAPIDLSTSTRAIVWSVGLLSIGLFSFLRRMHVNNRYERTKRALIQTVS